MAYGFDNAKDKEAVYTQAETATAMHSIFDPMIAAKQDQHKTGTATLLAGSWSSKQQTVVVVGVTADNTVLVSPVPANADDYTFFGVKCTGQGSGTLTFECDFTPESNIQFCVVILGVPTT